MKTNNRLRPQIGLHGTLEYIFVTDKEDLPQTVSKEKVGEIAANFMTTFYHIQIGALETQEFQTTPIPFWLVSFSDESIKGPAREVYFVVVLPNGKIVEPRVARRLQVQLSSWGWSLYWLGTGTAIRH